MIDIHCHVIHGVDDGPYTMEQSIEMVCSAEKAGIRTIIATPHSHETLFEAERLSENYQELLYRIRDYDVSLKLGYEVFINPSMPCVDRKCAGLTIQHTDCLLFELPFSTLPESGFELLSGIRHRDIVPILAHPERNRNFLRSFSMLSAYTKAGCMLQVDAASVLGVYGRDVRDFVKKLVKCNMVDFVASNAHCAEDYSSRYMKAYSIIAGWSGKGNADRLFRGNADIILNRQEKLNAMHAV